MRRQNTGDAEALPRGNHADFQIRYGEISVPGTGPLVTDCLNP